MTTGNPVLDKNLDCIAKYNPQLKEKILNLPYLTNQIDLIETELKEPNLSYNGIPIHSPKGAEAEAKKALGEVKNSPMSMHIIFGIGLGYLFKEFCQNSKGHVFLYEPNLEILRVTLELVDFSKELSQPNVFVASIPEIFNSLYKGAYSYGSNSAFLALNSYRNILYKEEIDGIVERIKIVTGTMEATFENERNNGYSSMANLLKNFSSMLDATPLSELKNIYKGKTALIVSAGPTLDLNIEAIKRNRNKVIIFCVGTAFKALASQGIVPDFVNIVERQDCSGQLKGFYLANINLIVEPNTNNSIHSLGVKRKFLFPSKGCKANNYWNELTETEPMCVVKGTVSYAALASAKILGCSKIILVGQDLAYVNNQCYSSGAAYSDLVYDIDPETKKPKFSVKNKQHYIESCSSVNPNFSQEAIENFAEEKFKKIEELLYYVKGITGEMLPSLGGMASFVDIFSEFAYLNKDLELINTSMIGAQINGFTNIPLEKALENNQPIEKIEISTSFKYDKQKFLKNLEKDLNKLKSAQIKINEAKVHIFKYEDALKRKNILTPELIQIDTGLMDIANTIKGIPSAGKYVFQYREILENKRKLIPDLTDLQVGCIQLLLPLYYELELENSNSLYQSISFKEKLEVNFIIKEYSELNQMEIVIIYNALKEYFNNVEKNTINIIEKIEEQMSVIGGNISLKS